MKDVVGTTLDLARPLLLATAVAAAWPANADTLYVNPDTGMLAVESCVSGICSRSAQANSVVFNGAQILAAGVQDGVREFRVAGDFRVNTNDRVTYLGDSSNYGVRFLVGNDAFIHGQLDFGARGKAGAAGGGVGGSGGAGGAGAAMSGGTQAAGLRGKGGAGGSGGDAAKAVFYYDIIFSTYEWWNFIEGGDGKQGAAGTYGVVGNAGLGGNSGGSGVAGGKGLNNLSGAPGGAGGAGGNGGDPGASRAPPIGGPFIVATVGGAGGRGGRLRAETNYTIHYDRSPEGGGDGASGFAGNNGQPGVRGNPGITGTSAMGPNSPGGTSISWRDAVLFAGSGGGGGGAGGQGGQGGGGAQGDGGAGGGGSGGDSYCDRTCGMLLNFGSKSSGPSGGAGGDGGAGSRGGAGGMGGAGGVGGGGGGAVDLVVRGTLVLGGTVSVRGADGTDGSHATWGEPSDQLRGAPGGAGSPGGTSRVTACLVDLVGCYTFEPVPPGGKGGDGGPGGSGGAGGAGGVSGAGGAGGAGSIRIVASRIIEEQQPVFHLMGGNSPNGVRGAAGQLYYGSSEGDRLSNASTPPGVALNIVDDITAGAFGARGANPFVNSAAGPVQTPFINGMLRDGTPLFDNGAELYGTVSRSAAGQAQSLMDALSADAPVGALAAIARRSSFAGMALEGFDALVFVNLTQLELADPMLEFSVTKSDFRGTRPGVDPGAIAPILSLPLSLLSGGWAEDEAFGGDGAKRLESLGAHDLFLTFVPTGLGGTFSIGANGLLATGPLAMDGAAAYLISQPVPEPTSWVLMGLGVCLVLMRRRTRSQARYRS